jgi:hypothetical protein
MGRSRVEEAADKPLARPDWQQAPADLVKAKRLGKRDLRGMAWLGHRAHRSVILLTAF